MAMQPTTSPHASPASPAASGGHGAAGVSDSAVSTAMDYAMHEGTYRQVTTMVKWAILCLAVLVVFLFIVIHPFVGAPPS
jgi:hypothetical protein